MCLSHVPKANLYQSTIVNQLRYDSFSLKYQGASGQVFNALDGIIVGNLLRGSYHFVYTVQLHEDENISAQQCAVYFYHDLQVMTIDSFNTFTVTVTPKSVLWMYTNR